MARTCCVSRPVCALCSAISVAINILAPASSTNDAAICATAKIRWRRLVLAVIRTLPLDRLNPLDVSPDGRRGTNAKITAATIASAAPTHSREAGGVASQDSHHRLRAHYTDRGASPAEQKAFGQQHASQRASACAERHADRQLTFTANRPCQNQVGDITTRDDEDQRRRCQQH